MWTLLNTVFQSRLILGTALFPSLECLLQSIKASEAQLITVSLKRQAHAMKDNLFWESIQSLGCRILPNTAGCRTAAEAVTTAEMARELFNTPWIKLEVIGDDYTLSPHPIELIKAAEALLDKGFEVFPYCTDDLVLCKTLVNLGCKVIMPWAAPIGSGRGLMNPYALKQLRDRLPDTTLIVDAGIGCPSDAVRAMELGFDGVLLNSAVAKSHDPIVMASAFAQGVRAGRMAFEAGIMPQRDFASPSTPLIDTPFWKQGASS